MARAKVVLDHAGMKALLNDLGVRADLTSRMGPVLAAAQAGAPVESGDYKASIHLVQATTDRAVVRVVADVSYAMSVEASTGNLARALDGSGGAALLNYTTKSGKKRKATQAQIDNWTRGHR